MADILRQELLFFTGLGIRAAVRKSHSNPATETMVVKQPRFTLEADSAEGVEGAEGTEEGVPFAQRSETERATIRRLATERERAVKDRLAMAEKGVPISLPEAERFERGHQTSFWSNFNTVPSQHDCCCCVPLPTATLPLHLAALRSALPALRGAASNGFM